MAFHLPFGNRLRHGGTVGGKRTPEYATWMNMKNRCTQKSHKRYPSYGGRGIKILYPSYQHFLVDVGPKPGPDYSIDRIDNDSHYMTGNCRWLLKSKNTVSKRRPK